jgi:FkbM family methyltransferase
MLASIATKPYYWRRPIQLLRRFQSSRLGCRDANVSLPWGPVLTCRTDETIGAAVARTGVHEFATTESLFRLIDPGEVVVDVGANIGYMTSIMAVAARPSGMVLAYEADPQVFRLLERNVARWNSQGGLATIRAVMAAVTAKSGSVWMMHPPGWEDNNGLSVVVDRQEADGFGTRGVTLDEQLEATDVAVLKLDIEGHEPHALAGADRLLRERRVRDIIYEEHGDFPGATSRMLEDNGYEILLVEQRPLGLRTVNPRTATAVSWDAPTLIACRDPARTRDRLCGRGWSSLGGRRPAA